MRVWLQKLVDYMLENSIAKQSFSPERNKKTKELCIDHFFCSLNVNWTFNENRNKKIFFFKDIFIRCFLFKQVVF